MNNKSPLKKQKKEYTELIKKIESKESAVGIDAQLTHAIIIDYLQQLTGRIENLEQKIDKLVK